MRLMVIENTISGALTCSVDRKELANVATTLESEGAKS